MSQYGVAQITLFLALTLAAAKPLGLYMARVFSGRRCFLSPILRPVEKLMYRVCGIRESEDQHWTRYAASLLAFSAAAFAFTYAIQRLQAFLPLNPARLGGVGESLSFNTAVSFLSNTNWQAYSPETTTTYLTQMLALAVQNFASAAAGIAVALGLIRGFVREGASAIGNFWVDMVRATLYVLLPLSMAGALLLVSQGVIQNFKPYAHATTLEKAEQTLPQGPVASQEAIKMIGTNGGGFFNANSAHPYENPTPVSNFMETLFIFLIPAGLTYMFGHMAGDARQGWALLAVMSGLFLMGVLATYGAEQSGNPILAKLGVARAPTAGQPGGNMEGKETRFGIPATALFAVVTTDASCGAVNGMHDSFTPLGGLVPLINIQLGEVIFGGVGSGLYGMLMFATLTVFLAGLMVGRTPEYLGKKIEQKEVKMIMLAVLALEAAILGFAAAGARNPSGLANGGPHGLSEILYAYSSAAGNNGSAFAGLSANSTWYNITLGLGMLAGRFLMIVPLLAAAGSLARKPRLAASAGTFPTHGPLFAGLLAAVIVIVGALTFFPALALGPIVEHMLMNGGQTFGILLGS
jgi:potassium-transporting ATPase potassium-binding subunit